MHLNFYKSNKKNSLTNIERIKLDLDIHDPLFSTPTFVVFTKTEQVRLIVLCLVISYKSFNT